MNHDINVGTYSQFDLNSKAGNSMKDNQLRIKRHIGHINGQKYDQRELMRQFEQEKQSKFKQDKLSEISSKLYQLETWLSPQIENKQFHQQAEKETKAKFQRYISDFQRQVENQEIHNHTNDLIFKMKSQKKHLADILSTSKKLDLKHIFEGQRLRDPLLNYRLQKKIQHVASKLQHIMMKEPTPSFDRSDDGHHKRNVKSQSPSFDHGKNNPKSEMVKNVEKVLRKFEEKNSVFDNVSRHKIHRMEAKLKVGPPLGKYTPKYDAIESPIRSPCFHKAHRMSADYINGNSPKFSNFKLEELHTSELNPLQLQKHYSTKISQQSITQGVNNDNRLMSQRCVRSLQKREDLTDGDTVRYSLERPLTKLIPDFEKAGDRRIIVGQRDVNERRFELKPIQLLEFSSKFKRLGCNISFNKQVYRQGYSSVSKSRKQEKRGSLSPGYYNPSYEAIHQRKDKDIQSWNREKQRKIKFDVTKQIKQRDSRVSVDEIIKEDEEIINTMLSRFKARRSSD